MKPTPKLGEQCEHGALKRQCRICELEAELEAAKRALVKVRAHTSYLPEAPRDLLVGLLASIERICAAAIRKGESHE